MAFDKFKDKFLKYYNFDDKSTKDKFKYALLKLCDEIKNRDDYRTITIKELSADDLSATNYKSDFISCLYNFNEVNLIVGIISPCWKRGWRNISNDPFISEQISEFMFQANKYVNMSYQINLIGAINFVYGLESFFEGEKLHRFRVSKVGEENLYYKFIKDIDIKKNNRYKQFKYVMKIINSLDPYVNRGVFYFDKLVKLSNGPYFEEFIVVSDNFIHTISEFVKMNLKIKNENRFKMNQIISEELDLDKNFIKYLDYIYKLRCSMAAHPAVSNWWDFYMLYEDIFCKILYRMKILFVKFLIYENQNRRIEKNPKLWSEWFMNYADIIYDSIWYDKLPVLEI